MNDDFLVFFFFSTFDKISACHESGCAFETVVVATFHLKPISTKLYKKIKNFVFFEKSNETLVLSHFQFSKFKNFFLIFFISFTIFKMKKIFPNQNCKDADR